MRAAHPPNSTKERSKDNFRFWAPLTGALPRCSSLHSSLCCLLAPCIASRQTRPNSVIYLLNIPKLRSKLFLPRLVFLIALVGIVAECHLAKAAHASIGPPVASAEMPTLDGGKEQVLESVQGA